VGQQVDESNLAARSLHLGHGRPNRRDVCRTIGEEAPQLGFELEQSRALRLGFGEHPVHQRLRLRFLVRGELEPILQLEDVHWSGIAVLVGRERHAEAAALADDLVEFDGARLGRLMTALVPVAELAPRHRRIGREQPEHRHQRRRQHSHPVATAPDHLRRISRGTW
jgi:hypothetical protein